jgi:hypothetical protein
MVVTVPGLPVSSPCQGTSRNSHGDVLSLLAVSPDERVLLDTSMCNADVEVISIGIDYTTRISGLTDMPLNVYTAEPEEEPMPDIGPIKRDDS